MTYKLLDAFQGLFSGKIYRHRVSTNGDKAAVFFFEDLYELNRSPKYVARIKNSLSVVNRANKARGIVARRGDGSFGEIIPNITPVVEAGFVVGRGEIATIEIGVEVKIMQKAMIKQIDRVISDLDKQVTHFRAKQGNPICIGLVGINQAPYAVGYEKERQTKTDGNEHKHPAQEAAEAERRLIARVAPKFDEFIVLRYIATNESPFDFTWTDLNSTERDYGAALARVSTLYQQRF